MTPWSKIHKGNYGIHVGEIESCQRLLGGAGCSFIHGRRAVEVSLVRHRWAHWFRRVYAPFTFGPSIFPKGHL